MAYQAKKPLTNWRKQLPPPPARRHDPSHFTAAKALIQRTIDDPPYNRPRTAMVYEQFSLKADCIATFNRADAVLLPRPRAEHTTILKVCAHLLDPAAGPTMTVKASVHSFSYHRKMRRIVHHFVYRHRIRNTLLRPKNVSVNRRKIKI